LGAIAARFEQADLESVARNGAPGHQHAELGGAFRGSAGGLGRKSVRPVLFPEAVESRIRSGWERATLVGTGRVGLAEHVAVA
jgi:hypothetical protein